MNSTVTFADHHVCHGQAARLVLYVKLQADVVTEVPGHDVLRRDGDAAGRAEFGPSWKGVDLAPKTTSQEASALRSRAHRREPKA